MKKGVDKAYSSWYNIQAVTEKGKQKALCNSENGPWKLNNKSKKYKA